MIPASEPCELERSSSITRLRDIARFVCLVADQMEALESHDAARLRELTEERDTLEETLRPAPDDTLEVEEGQEEPTPLPISEELSHILSEALERLDRVAEESLQERHRWIFLGDDALRALQGARLRAARGGQYVKFSSTNARVDVRF